jgi:hypothetical protein
MYQPLVCFGGIDDPATGPGHGFSCPVYPTTEGGLQAYLWANPPGFPNPVYPAARVDGGAWSSCDVNHGPFCTGVAPESPCVASLPDECTYTYDTRIGPGIDVSVDSVGVHWTVINATVTSQSASLGAQPRTIDGPLVYEIGIAISGTGVAYNTMAAVGSFLSPELSIPPGTVSIEALLELETINGSAWALSNYGPPGDALTSDFVTTIYGGDVGLTGNYNVTMIMVNRSTGGGNASMWRQIFGDRAWGMATLATEPVVTVTLLCQTGDGLREFTTESAVAEDGTFAFSFAVLMNSTTPFDGLRGVVVSCAVVGAAGNYTVYATTEMCTSDTLACSNGTYVLDVVDESSSAVNCVHVPMDVGAVCPLGYCTALSECVTCIDSSQCIQTGCTGACVANECVYTCGTNCVYSYVKWLLGVHAVSMSLQPRFLPLTIGGDTIRIVTKTQLINALLGWGFTNPTHMLAGVLVVAKLNTIKGAVPPTDVIAMMDAADAIVHDCFAFTTAQWTTQVLRDSFTCGGLRPCHIASIMIILNRYNEGFTEVHRCPSATFPTGN